MRVHGKRYRKQVELVDRSKTYSVEEAVKLLKKMAASNGTKFDQTVQLSLNLGIDPRQADQALRGSFAFPHGIGKQRSVVVFADGEEAKAAEEAGADEVGTQELAKRIQDGWTGFDVCLALQRTMKFVGRLGKILGPKGLMPNPKNGTIVQGAEELARAVREFKAGRVEYRNDPQGNLHVPVGKISFEETKLRENVEAFLENLRKIRPSSVKGTFVRNAAVAASAGPAIRLRFPGM